MGDPSRGARPHADDSGATKLLKEVLRSNAKMSSSAMSGGRRWWGPDIQMPASTAPSKEKDSSGDGKRRSFQKSQPSLDEPQLRALIERTDSFCLKHAEGTDLSPILSGCGRKIGETAAKLRILETDLTSAPPRYLADAGDMRIQNRPEEAISVARSRIEEAAARAIHEHAKFQQLDKVDTVIGKTTGFEDLRKAFPNRFKHHPNCILITDDILKRPEELKACMWRNPARPPDEDDFPSIGGTGTRLSQFPAANFRQEREKRRAHLADPVQQDDHTPIRRERSAPILVKT